MLKKIFISAVLLIAVLSFVVSLLGGKGLPLSTLTARLWTVPALNRLCWAARRLQPAAS